MPRGAARLFPALPSNNDSSTIHFHFVLARRNWISRARLGLDQQPLFQPAEFPPARPLMSSRGGQAAIRLPSRDAANSRISAHLYAFSGNRPRQHIRNLMSRREQAICLRSRPKAFASGMKASFARLATLPHGLRLREVGGCGAWFRRACPAAISPAQQAPLCSATMCCKLRRHLLGIPKYLCDYREPCLRCLCWPPPCGRRAKPPAPSWDR
jgi:hypothetical protein